jgi:hypothetical protein
MIGKGVSHNALPLKVSLLPLPFPPSPPAFEVVHTYTPA